MENTAKSTRQNRMFSLRAALSELLGNDHVRDPRRREYKRRLKSSEERYGESFYVSLDPDSTQPDRVCKDQIERVCRNNGYVHVGSDSKDNRLVFRGKSDDLTIELDDVVSIMNWEGTEEMLVATYFN